MKLVLNFKDGKKKKFDEDETRKVLKSINYLKLLKYVSSSKRKKEEKFKILDEEYNTKQLKSIEMVL